MSTPSPFQRALDEGYSKEEVLDFASKHPKYSEKIKRAKTVGYSDSEISDFLFQKEGERQTERPSDVIGLNKKNLKPAFTTTDVLQGAENIANKAARIGTQFAMGSIQGATFPYDMAAMAAKSAGIRGAPLEFRQEIFKEINSLAEKKSREGWDEKDKSDYDFYFDLIKNPEKAKKFIPKDEDLPDFDVSGLIENVAEKFGLDLSPRDKLEVTARWIGFLKNLKNAKKAMKNPNKVGMVKGVAEGLVPTGTEAASSILAAEALEIAKEGDFGMLGTTGLALSAHSLPLFLKGAFKGLLSASKESSKALREVSAKTSEVFAENIKDGELTPKGKKFAAKYIAKMTPKNKLATQTAIINDMRAAGIQADAGTITGNFLVQNIQTKMSQSGLVGEPLEAFRKKITQQAIDEYKEISSGLGEYKFNSEHEAGEFLKEGIKEARDKSREIHRELYAEAAEAAGNDEASASNVGRKIIEIKKKLGPGALKSADQATTLKALKELEKDFLSKEVEVKLYTEADATIEKLRSLSDAPKIEKIKSSTRIDAMLNNLRSLSDMINFEAQGTSKSLLKSIRKEIQNSLEKHSVNNPRFAKLYREANAAFEKHAKTFRGHTLKNFLKDSDPASFYKTRFNTVKGIRDVKKALSSTPEGRELFNKLAATKLEEMVGKNLVNSTTNQLNFGTFSKLLEKGKNRALAKELLSPQSFKRLERLQKASGRIADTGQKFFNASQSGVNIIDAGVMGKIISDFSKIFSGDPFALASSLGGLAGARKISKLLADPEFLKLLEDAMLMRNKASPEVIKSSANKMVKRINEIDGTIIPSIAEEKVSQKIKRLKKSPAYAPAVHGAIQNEKRKET